MHFKNFSAAVMGIDAYLMEVEVDVGSGKPGDFNIVGLPDIAVKESRERIKAALGEHYPTQMVFALEGTESKEAKAPRVP